MSHKKVCHPGCECDPCQRLRKVNRRRSKLNRMGVSATVPAAPATRHVARLIKAGMLPEHIAQASGLGPATISEVRQGVRGRIKRETAAAIVGVRPQAGRTVPKTGTVRRARALVAIGWTYYEIEARAGLARGYLRLITNRDQARCLASVAVAVADVYDDMSMQPGPSNRQRVFARNRGWAPPLCWDESTIDDPAATPIGAGYVGVTRAEALADLADLGLGVTDVCRRLRMSRESLALWCRRHNHTDLYATLVARESNYWVNQHGEGGAA